MTARWTSIALIVSAALNLFLLGTAITVIAMGAHRTRHWLPQRTTLRAAALSLPPDQRSRFIALLRAEGDGIEVASRQARDLRAAAWGSLTAPTFDSVVAKGDLARARALNQASRGKVEDGVLDFVAALPPGDRARFGEAMRRRSARQDPAAARAKLADQP